MQTNRRRHSYELFFTLFLFAFFVLALVKIACVTEGMRAALSLCAEVLIPTLFPFLVLSDLLLSFRGTRRVLLRLSHPFARLLGFSDEGGACFLLGNLFGFPIGVRSAARCHRLGTIQKEELCRIFCTANNASPFFLIGFVGAQLLGSSVYGVFLYLLQFILSILSAILLKSKRKKPSFLPKAEQAFPVFSFTASVQGAAMQALYLCAYVLFFSVVSALFAPYLSNGFLHALFLSFLEIGNATAFIGKAFPLSLALPLCAFSTCFSGLSVYFQAKDCLRECDVSTALYLPVKLACGTVAFFLSLLFLKCY